MSNTVALQEGVWCLHVLTNHAVPGPGYMDPVDPTGYGTSTDVNLTFSVGAPPESQDIVGPDKPLPFAVPWLRADFPQDPPVDSNDNKAHRGTYWARVFPAAYNDLAVIQLLQVDYPVGYPANIVQQGTTFRLFSGRLYGRAPIMFFGHGAGNDGGQNLSFTLTQGACPKP